MCISWTVWHAFINNNWYWSGNNRSAKWQLPRVKFPVQTIKFPFCVYECVRACVRVCVCVWRRVTCLFHGIKEQLKTEKMWQTIPILFDYHTNFSFSCLVLNLQWHNQTIAVYQISTIKQVHQFSKQFFYSTLFQQSPFNNSNIFHLPMWAKLFWEDRWSSDWYKVLKPSRWILK